MIFKPMRMNKNKHNNKRWGILSSAFSLVSLIFGILTLIFLCGYLEIQSPRTFVDMLNGRKRYVGGYAFYKPDSSCGYTNYTLALKKDKTAELWIPHPQDELEIIKGNWELRVFGGNYLVVHLSKPAILILGRTYLHNAFLLYVKGDYIYATYDAMQAKDYTQATRMKKVY